MRLLILATLLCLLAPLPPAAADEALKAEIERTYGIEVEFDEIEFPDAWRDWYTPVVKPVAQRHRKNALTKLRADLQRLDANVLKRHVSRIFIVGYLAFDDVHYCGTAFYPNKWLYIDKLWLDNTGDKAMGFHHEFSSLLVALNRFPVKEWKALNPEGYVYPMQGETTALLTKGDTDLAGTPETYRDGFVAGYGRMDLENDINTYFQLLIANPAKLSDLEWQYPAIRRKAELLRGFYRGVVAGSKLAE